MANLARLFPLFAWPLAASLFLLAAHCVRPEDQIIDSLLVSSMGAFLALIHPRPPGSGGSGGSGALAAAAPAA